MDKVERFRNSSLGECHGPHFDLVRCKPELVVSPTSSCAKFLKRIAENEATFFVLNSGVSLCNSCKTRKALFVFLNARVSRCDRKTGIVQNWHRSKINYNGILLYWFFLHFFMSGGRDDRYEVDSL